MTLDCGHANDWQGGAAAVIDDKKVCRTCAHANEREHLKQRNHAFCYLVGDNIQDFTGLKLGEVQGAIEKHQVKTQRELWTFWMKDVHGQLWSCRHWPNSGDYVRCRKMHTPPKISRRPHLPNASSQYGARLGRYQTFPNLLPDETAYVNLWHIRLDSGGYDSGGAYWGIGNKLWHAFGHDKDGDEICLFLRASTRAEAKADLKADYPGLRFFR